jgi:peptide/nickel transport system ATP-binding protein
MRLARPAGRESTGATPAQAVEHSTGTTTAVPGDGAIALEARGLVKEYRVARGRHSVRLVAVRDVSLALRPRVIVALVGESGSGKSTVAKLLAGQERATGGQILLDGVEVNPASRAAFRAYKSNVQMVFQDPFSSLNPVHKIQYHLERPLRIHGGTSSGAEVAANAAQLLEDVRLTPPEQYLSKFPHELSGGQRQRVAIARALAVRPRVLLADEPVSMLDVSIRLGVLDLIDQLRFRFDLAVLYITHDIASARYFADETYVMYAGEIVERGPSEELTQQPAHPYTQLLVSASPDPDRLGRQLDAGLEAGVTPAVGRSGSSLASAVGCRFSLRCPLADERCRTQSPPLERLGRGRAVACWRGVIAAPPLLTKSQ